MDKIFSTRIQEINSPTESLEGYVSFTLAFDPQDKFMEESRGKLFIVLDLRSENVSKNDLNSAAKLLFGVIKETYYGDADGTPLQALEKALHTARDKVSNMPISNGGVLPLNTDLNIVVSALWGKILYIAQFGSCSAYLIRKDKVLEIGKSTKGDVTISSGIAEKGDVLVLGSSEFRTLFSAETVLSNISKLNDPSFLKENPKISAVIVKFEVTDFWGRSEIVNFVSPKRIKSSLLNLFPKPAIKVPAETFRERSKKRFVLMGILALLLVAALGTSIVFTLKKEKLARVPGVAQKSSVSIGDFRDKVSQAKDLMSTDKKKAAEMLGEVVGVKEDSNMSSSDKEDLSRVLGEATSLLDDMSNTRRISEPELFYDASGSGFDDHSFLAGDKDNLFIFSRTKALGLVVPFGSKEASPFNPEGRMLSADLYSGMVYSVLDDGLFVSGTKGLSFAKKDVSGISNFADSKSLKVYYGNVYLLDGSLIYKLGASENTFSSWLKDATSLDSAVDIAIDGNVYVLFKDGEVKKLYMGEQDKEFSLKGLPEDLQNPKEIYTNIDLNEIYILDDRAIYVFDKVGGYQRRYALSDKAQSFFLSSDAKSIYFLVGAKVYKFSL